MSINEGKVPFRVSYAEKVSQFMGLTSHYVSANQGSVPLRYALLNKDYSIELITLN